MPRPLPTWRSAGGAPRRPIDPAALPDEELELFNRASAGEEFITGNGFARRCGWVLNYGSPTVNPEGRSDWCFCKTDFVDDFFARHLPKSDFVLVSHNSDIVVGEHLSWHLRQRRLRAWLATNVDVEHPKLRAIPIGIANPRWPHGDVDAVRRVRADPPCKSRLFDVSFSLDTNPSERRYCVEQTGLAPAPPRPFDRYLVDLASSYFSLSPRGNGIDAHRTWESLYVGTIPVVTRSVLADQHRDLPLVVLDDWSEFRTIDFSPELYTRLWRGWDRDAIRLDRYVERLAAAL